MLLRGEKGWVCLDFIRILELVLYVCDVYIVCLCLVVIGLEKKEKEFCLLIYEFDKV